MAYRSLFNTKFSIQFIKSIYSYINEICNSNETVNSVRAFKTSCKRFLTLVSYLNALYISFNLQKNV